MEDVTSPVPSPVPSENGGGRHPGSEVPMLFVGVSLTLGIVCRQLLHGSRVPYTVALLVLGTGLGALEYGTKEGLGILGTSIRMWANIDPSLILFLFLPALLFESSFALEIHQIKIVLLAGPGVVITAFSLGLVHQYLFPYGWNRSTSLLLGAVLSSTDPVAVISVLNELGASKKLHTIIAGESLMNDGTAILMYRLFLRMTLCQRFTAPEIIFFLSRISMGSVALGLLVGLISIIWLATVFNDTVIEIILTFTASYMAFFVAEDEAQVSGVLTVMTIGIFFAAFARTAFTGESEKSMHNFWQMIAYMANTLIFILSGVIIAESILRSQGSIDGRDWGYLVLLYVFVQLSRVLLMLVLYPGLRYSGYGLDWKESVVLVWAGLRGSVALALSLLVSQVGVKDPAEYNFISEKTQAQFVFFTGGVVFLTLIINGSTAQFLVRLLGQTRPSHITDLMLNHAKLEMHRKALEVHADLGEDEEFGPADWEAVKQYVSCLNQISEAEPPVHPHASTASGLPMSSRLQDTRLRFLHGVQAAYWKMLEEGRVTHSAAIILIQSVDEALDVARDGTLQDWKGLHSHVHFPWFLKDLQWRSYSWVPQRLITYFLIEQLELGCYLSAAFLRAHREVQQHLHNFIGESEVADAIIRESEAQGDMARQFLEDVRLSFAQVLRAIKTKQVTRAILLHLTDYVETLKKAGLLGENEVRHLQESVQADLKKLMKRPALVKMPLAAQLLTCQPFVEALPARLQAPLLKAAKEFVKLRGSVLYREDSKPDGIWLIANGVIQWSSKASEGKRLPHSTFYHGSVLGLYETLTGKPRLCTIITNSVVHCFFIERAKVLAALQSLSELDDFFWKEGGIVVAKLLLSQWFEGLSVQTLRAAVAEGSCLQTYLSGEVVEIRDGVIGILLEGFLRLHGKEDIISAPAGLVLKSYSPDSGAAYRGSHFQVQTPARVLLFNLAVLSSECVLQSPFQSRKIPRLPSLEQLGWIERIERNGEDAREKMADPRQLLTSHSSKYSARALELGLLESKLQGNGLEATLITRRSSSRLASRNPSWGDESSDNSYAEDDYIVQVDSPSSLFHLDKSE